MPTLFKQTPVFGGTMPVLGMKRKQVKSVIWLVWKTPIKALDLFIYIVVDRFIFENNHIALDPVLPSYT